MQTLIKRFSIGDDYYVYDSPTNEISKVTKVIWDILEFYGNKTEEEIVKILSKVYSEEQIQKGIDSIRTAISRKGLFADTRPSEIRPFFTPEELKKKLEEEVEHLILGISERCNFRCYYCTYSGKYKNYRQHSNTSMNMQTAIKAVDFFRMHSINTEEPNIGFYGGEPLLEFPLIKKVVGYSQKMFEGSVLFSMTTNGSLLNDEKIKFLIDNHFSILVSLDGPQEIHDRYRRFSNGKGTFQKIYKNLERFREIDENYFCKNVSVTAVLSPPLDYLRIYDFFCSDPVFKDIKISVSSVSDDEHSFFENFGSENLHPKGMDKLYKIFRKDLIKKGQCENVFLREIFERPFLNIHRRMLFKQYDQSYHPRGICYPGQRRLFVNPKGELLMCERTSDSLVIGNIETGYDVERIFEILDTYSRPLNQVCLDCWALRLCDSCFANNFSINGFDNNGIPKNCADTRESILDDLHEYCSILNENPHAFDYMKDIVIS